MSTEATPDGKRAPKTRTMIIALVVVTLVFVGLFLTGYVPLIERQAALRAETKEMTSAAPRVEVMHPRQVSGDEDIDLPGTIEAIEETTIYARVNGYLKKWHVDIGDRVKAGALLAEIETPELDEEKLQAEAAVGQAKARLLTADANVRLAASSYERYKGAAERGGISPQELAEREAAVETAQAAVAAAKADIAAGEANVRRLNELLSFAKVHAPFPGTITRRSIDVGALITAGNGASQALFRLARIDPVRVFVSVPQSYAPEMKAGSVAELRVREFPNRPFEGKVTRSAGALDPASRTLLTQIEIPNPDHTLLPGMYVRARLVLPHGSSDLRIPASALIVTHRGTEVAVLEQGDRVAFRKVDVSADYGTELAVNGLSGSDRVVVDPGTRLVEGTVVAIGSKDQPQEASADAGREKR